MKRIIALLIAIMFSLGLVACASTTKTEEPKVTEEETTEAETVPVVLDGDYADINLRDYGTITIKFEHDAAPETVKNFIKLASSGFYDGLTFHRIKKGFMMQGGDPTGTGTGGSEEYVKGEFSDNGWNNPLSHTAGAVSMARGGDFDSASSQFFIVHKDSKFLDGQYAIFAYVTDGMDIVDKICNEAEPMDDFGMIAPEKRPVIESITIR